MNVKPITPHRAPDTIGPAPNWTLDAICAQTDPDLFFPEKGEADKTRAAKMICGPCPVWRQCLADALAREGATAASHRFGVWGGYSPRERERIAHVFAALQTAA